MPAKITLLVALTLVTLAPASAATPTVLEGDILVGHPATGTYGGVTELAAPCDVDSAFNGIDGVWFSVDGLQGLPVVATMDLTLDVDLFFYSASCLFLDDIAAGFLGETETGTVPANAAYLIVDGFAGAGHFVVMIG